VSTITFGMFAFDPDSGVLTREGRPVRLQPQPARVLGILVAHAGDVVARETLRQQVWADGTFVDFERGLNFCIAQIRSALGDSADSPRFIETLPRRGYRFIAPVGKRDAAEPPPAKRTADERPGNQTRPRSVAWASLAGLIVFLVELSGRTSAR